MQIGCRLNLTKWDVSPMLMTSINTYNPPKTNIEPEKRPLFRGKPAFSAFMLVFWVGYTNTRLLVGGFNFFETS